jgi:hypothetical protein
MRAASATADGDDSDNRGAKRLSHWRPAARETCSRSEKFQCLFALSMIARHPRVKGVNQSIVADRIRCDSRPRLDIAPQLTIADRH